MDPKATIHEFSRLLGKANADRRKELSEAYSGWRCRGGFLPSYTKDRVKLSVVGLMEKNGFPYLLLGDRTMHLAVGLLQSEIV